MRPEGKCDDAGTGAPRTLARLQQFAQVAQFLPDGRGDSLVIARIPPLVDRTSAVLHRSS